MPNQFWLRTHGLGDTIRLWDEISKIQNGEEVWNGVKEWQGGKKYLLSRAAVIRWRAEVQDGIREALATGKLEESWTENKIQRLIETMIDQLKSEFERFTCIFDGNKYQISEELTHDLMGYIPWYNRRTHIIEFNVDKIYFRDLSDTIIETMSLYDFYDYYIALNRWIHLK